MRGQVTPAQLVEALNEQADDAPPCPECGGRAWAWAWRYVQKPRGRREASVSITVVEGTCGICDHVQVVRQWV